MCRLGFALICIPSVLATCADAQVDRRCAEAAALWIPSSTSVEKTVVKWNDSVKYSFVLSQGDEPSIKHSIEETLRLLAQASGLKVELAESADVAIFVAPDISAVGPGIRKNVEDFLQELFSSGKFQGKGRLEIDPAKWEAKFQSADVKCAGVDVTVNGTIVRAFNWFQTDESAACVRVGLGELFGLINIRKYHSDRGGTVPADLIAAATRTLYDTRVVPGASRVEAEKIVAEVCR